MANVRIKDIQNTTTSAADDDYLAIDGETNGTRKILTKNIQPETDTTLTIAGKAADAKAAGSAFDKETVLIPTVYQDSELTWESGVKYYNGVEYTGGVYDAYHYVYFDVMPGDIISTVNGRFRDRCEFLDNVVVSTTNITNFNDYVVPDGVNKIAMTRLVTETSDLVIKRSSLKFYISKDSLSKNLPDAIEDALENGLEKAVSPKNTDFFHISSNLINPDTCLPNTAINQQTGVPFAVNGHSCSDYMSVEPNSTYLFRQATGRSDGRICYYTSEKAYITGALYPQMTTQIVTTPSNAAFARVSLYASATDIMFAAYESGDSTEFEPYNNPYVLPEYILGDDLSDVVLNLPEKIYALVGYELNIYFENLVENWTEYNWDVSCTKGDQMQRGYKITPTANDVGTYDLTFVIQKGDSTKQKTVSLIITGANAGSGISEKVMILGDSTTNNGIAVTKLNQNFSNDVMNITTIGTRGTSPNNHEGRSGWTFRQYFGPPNAGDIAAGVENPWYNPTTETFDASYYFTETGIAKPDWFFINLGINDVFGYWNDPALETQITACKNYCDLMIASMNEASANTKIGICLTIPPNHSQDAFGKAYHCGQTRDRYKHNNVLFVSALIEEYDGRESEGLYLIPIYTNLDTVYNMGLETLPVNARNTAITYESPIANGGVHPVESGYWQIADIYTAFLKGNA